MEQSRALSAVAVTALCLTHLVAMANRSMFSAIVPLLGKRYGYSDTELGILLGPAFAVTYAVAAIAFGLVADRRPPRHLVLGGLMVLIVATVTIAMSDHYGLFFAGQVMTGLGQAALIPAAMLLIARDTANAGPSPGLRPPALSLFTGASAMGRSGGLMLAGAVLAITTAIGLPAATIGWRMLPALTIVAMVALLIFCVRQVPSDQPIEERISVTPHAMPAGLMILFFAAIGPVLVGQSLAAWVPTMLVRARGFEVAHAAAFFGVLVLVMAVGGQIVGGLATKRFAWVSRHPVAANAACLILAQPFLLIATRAEARWLIAGGLAAVLMLVGMASYIALHAVQRLSPPARRGAVTGLFLSLVTLAGAGGGPLLIGLISDAGLTRDPVNGLGLGMMVANGVSAGAIGLLAVAMVVRRRDMVPA